MEWKEVDLPFTEEHRLMDGTVRPEGYEPRTPHKLIVRRVGDSDWDFEDYEIEHLPTCPHYVVSDAPEPYDIYQCDVGYEQANNGDVKWSLKYSGTPVTEPGEYWIAAWFETIRGFDYTEYDGGLHLLADEEIQQLSTSS